jgi:hypothetical protein
MKNLITIVLLFTLMALTACSHKQHGQDNSYDNASFDDATYK